MSQVQFVSIVKSVLTIQLHEPDLKYQGRGQDLLTGGPFTLFLSEAEGREALQKFLS